MNHGQVPSLSVARLFFAWLVFFAAAVRGSRAKVYAETSDEELMRLYSAGDPGAFDAIFTRYGGMLLAYLERQLFRRDEAADLLQDVFLQVHRARADYDPSRPFRPWIYTVARNLLRDHFRRVGRKREVNVGEGLELHPDEGVAEPLQALVAEEVRAALATLPDDQRDAIVLHWLEGFSFPEVAEIVGAKLSAVKVRAHRGYRSLAKRLER